MNFAPDHRRYFLLIASLLISVLSRAQQQPQYSLYMYGGLLYNPAYAGVSGGLNARVFGRWQWVGFEGAPNTQTLAVDSDIPGKNIGLGLLLSRDELAITSSANVTMNYAYHIKTWGGKLSMGVSGSLSRMMINYNDAYVLDDDVNFVQQVISTSPNFGLGFYFDHPDFWLGTSVPGVLSKEYNSNGETFYSESRHYFIAGGYRWEVSPRWRLEPNLLIKAVEGTTLGADLNLMARVDDRIAAGVGYRPTEAVTMMLQMQINEELGFGYAFDYTLNDQLANISSNSHEVMLSYNMKWNRADSDKDGTVDKKDDCPTQFGPAFNNGCPTADTDGDGIPDHQDLCPENPGNSRLRGCPDTDGDGVIDPDDNCPSVPGASARRGCPDYDKDGVIDEEDPCPNVYGTSGGCPDSDDDGVDDAMDKCRYVFGLPENDGCPAVKDWERSVLEDAVEGVQFEPGKDVITFESYRILNRIANIMYDNTLYNLKIKGYTDSSGNDAMNLRLSQARANSVKAYLVDLGVRKSRIEATGYGEEDPIASNATASGRARNRRVEFELGY